MKQSCDILVLGSGFAGSLTAMLLRRIGLRVCLVDRARHPRFAIGESSTPIANKVLRDLCGRYDLPQLASLTRYGDWVERHSEIRRGCKRGFSYFSHPHDAAFSPEAGHPNELLVAASSERRLADTQWHRADVDQFFCRQAEQLGVGVWQGVQSIELERRPAGGWRLKGASSENHSSENPRSENHSSENHSSENPRSENQLAIDAAMAIDATGAGGALSRTLKLDSVSHRLRTRTRAVFSHFLGVGSWDKRLGATDDHPFPSDDAAQHHLGRDSWMWLLRFDGGLTSAGIVFREASEAAPEAEWREWLRRAPSVEALFAEAVLAESPGALISSGPLQRLRARAAGDDWALLPNAAGFVDPLHSTGIAHSLCGVERLVTAIERHWGKPSLAAELARYERVVLDEFALIDRLVHGCYAAINDFPLFVAYSMLYFAAATSYERERAMGSGEFQTAFLCADRADFRQRVATAHDALLDEMSLPPERRERARFQQRIAALIEPYNQVGLCDESVANMYRYTAAPQ